MKLAASIILWIWSDLHFKLLKLSMKYFWVGKWALMQPLRYVSINVIGNIIRAGKETILERHRGSCYLALFVGQAILLPTPTYVTSSIFIMFLYLSELYRHVKALTPQTNICCWIFKYVVSILKNLLSKQNGRLSI